MRCFSFVTVVAALLAASVPAVAAQVAPADTVALKNPGFEGEFKPVASSSDAPGQKARITGVIADGWSDNSNWADVDVAFSRETVNPHSGESAQKVAVNRVTGGAVQLVQNTEFRKGRVHRLRAWMRGQPGASVTVSLRRADAPYTEYASENFPLSAEWQEFRVFGIVPEDVRGFLMIRAGQPGTFWVDDVTLEDLTEARSNAPARVGNLIPSGGSFETGLPYGWSVRYQGSMANSFADTRPVTDKTEAREGKASLRCDILPKARVRVGSPIFDFNYNRPHTLSFWVRAARPETSVSVGLEKTSLYRSFKAGPEWQRVSVSGNPPYLPYTRLVITTPDNETGALNTLWIDGVQVEERAEASPEYAPAYPVEATLTLALPGHVAFVGEKATVALATAGALPKGARLNLSAVDLAGKKYTVPAVKLPASSFPLPDFSGRRGMWKLSAQVVDSGGKPLSAMNEMIWSRLPAPREIEPKKSYFGTHISLAPRFIALARRIGARRVRLHDTSMIGKWAVAEPEQGKFEFHDEGVTAAAKGGLTILGMLDGAPRWASTKPREGGYWNIWHIPDAPGAVGMWENYVRTVTGHYKGRIDEWEVWNEPWGNWFNSVGGTPEQYAELMTVAYRTLKEQNPKGLLVGVDTYRGRDDWTTGVLKAAGTDDFDAFSYHDYNDAFYGGPEAFPVSQAKAWREFQRPYGTPKPLWNTEGGLFGVGSWYAPVTGGMRAALQPAYIVRYDVTHMAAGVKNFYLYAIHTDPMMGQIDTVGTEFDNSAKPILAARAVLAHFVDGVGAPTRTEPVKGIDCYTYPAEKGRRVSVLWSYDSAPHRVPVPKGVKVLDIWSNPIPATGGSVNVGPEPVYFIR